MREQAAYRNAYTHRFGAITRKKAANGIRPDASRLKEPSDLFYGLSRRRSASPSNSSAMKGRSLLAFGQRSAHPVQ